MRAILLALCLGLAAAAQTPAPKLQFEVASVKPSQQGEGNLMMMMSRMLDMMPPGMIPMPDAGLVRIKVMPLRHLIAAAYRVRADKIFGPSWMAETYFDVEAKLPARAKKENANEMLQALLTERFGVELHRETRELPGFALIVGKSGPKMEEAVPAKAELEPASPEDAKERQEARIKAMQDQMRQRMQERERSGGPPHPGMSTSNWTSITMSAFAEQLARMANGPVVDETGLTGKYKVSVQTWRGTDDDPEQTIFQAVEQLGLKLAPRKVSAEIIVVDKASKTPTEN